VVVDAGQKTMVVIWGRRGAMRLLHLLLHYLVGALPLKCQSCRHSRPVGQVPLVGFLRIVAWCAPNVPGTRWVGGYRDMSNAAHGLLIGCPAQGMMEHVTRVSLPPAIEPFYRCPRRNQSVVLFRGRVDLVGTASAEPHRGGIVLDWLPTPTLRCWARGPLSELAMELMSGTENLNLVPQTPTRGVPRQAKTTRGGSRSASQRFETDIRLSGVECGDASVALSYALLHIVNFPKLHGPSVAWPDGTMASGRLRLEGGGWTIVMDRIPGTRTLHDELKGSGGFGLTHTARVLRTSGDMFTPAELKSFVEAFTYFCWLCAETRCGPILPVGFDSRENAVWSLWKPTRTESFTSAATWLDMVHANEAKALFPTFMARWGDPYWREVVAHAIDYLIEAGRPNPVDRAIVMAQILLETLSYSWLVVERSLLTHGGFEDRRRSAAENICAMMTDMGVPVAMPANFGALERIRTGRGRAARDGPDALVITRNGIIHRRRRAPTGPRDFDPLIDAWRLGAWDSELAVLRLCGFMGQYRSRLSDEVEPVPWQQVVLRR